MMKVGISTVKTEIPIEEMTSFDADVEAVRLLYSQYEEDNVGRILLEGIVYNITRESFQVSMEASRFAHEFAGGLGYLIGCHFKHNGQRECQIVDKAIRNFIEYRLDKSSFRQKHSTGNYPQDELLEVINAILR